MSERDLGHTPNPEGIRRLHELQRKNGKEIVPGNDGEFVQGELIDDEVPSDAGREFVGATAYRPEQEGTYRKSGDDLAFATDKIGGNAQSNFDDGHVGTHSAHKPHPSDGTNSTAQLVQWRGSDTTDTNKDVMSHHGSHKTDTSGHNVPGKQLVPHRQQGTDLVPLQEAEAEKEPNHPHGQELTETGESKDKRLVFAVSGLSEGVESAAAYEVGQKEFDEMMAKPGNWLRRMGRGIVKGNILREAIRYTNRNKAANRIAETGRLHDMSEADWQQVSAESIQRVLDDEGTGEYMNQHEESRESLDGAKGAGIKSVVNRLVTEYVSGNLSAADLQEGARREFAQLATQDAETAGLIGAGNVYMSNILDIAEAVKGQITHERGIKDVLDQIDYVSARVNTDVNTEAKANRFQKFLDRNPLNLPAFATAGLAIWYGVGAYAAKTAVGKATRLATVGVGSAGIAYFQEKARLTHERAQVGREVAAGESVDGTERRQRLAETLYDMKDASIMMEAMRSSLDSDGKYTITDQTGFDKLFTAAVDTTSRYDLSAREKADFIRFDGGRENIAAQRREFLAERFRAKAALRRYYNDQRAANPSYAGGLDFDAFYDNATDGMQHALMLNMDKQDTEYKSVSRHYALKRAGQALMWGMVLGTAMQEGVALASDNQQGVIEGMAGWNDDAAHDTVLETGREWIMQPFHDQETDLAGYNALTDHIQVDENLTLTTSAAGIATITGPNGMHLEVPMNADGTMTADAINRLHSAGIAYSDTPSHIPGETEVVDSRVSVKEFMENNGTKVHRQWFDNDTPAPKFDLNELRLDLETDKHGNFLYNAGRMLKGDSFHNGRVSGMDMGDNMKLLISPTKGTQSEPFVIDVDSHGQAIIPKDSPIAQLFEMKNGKPEFKGAYAEWAQVDGTRADGSLNVTMLATDVGNNEHISSFVEQVKKTSSTTVHDIKLTLVDKAAFADLGPAHDAGDVKVDFVPIIGRGGLRRNRPGEDSNTASPDKNNTSGNTVAVSGNAEKSKEKKKKQDIVVPPVPPAPAELTGGGAASNTSSSRYEKFLDSLGGSDKSEEPSKKHDKDRHNKKKQEPESDSSSERPGRQFRRSFAEGAHQARKAFREAYARGRQESRSKAEARRQQHNDHRARFEERRKAAEAEDAANRAAQEEARRRQQNEAREKAEQAARQRAADQEQEARQQQADREARERQEAENARRSQQKRDAQNRAERESEQQRPRQNSQPRKSDQEKNTNSQTKEQTPVQEAQNGNSYREATRNHNAAVKHRDYWEQKVREFESAGTNISDPDFEYAKIRHMNSVVEVARYRREMIRLMREAQGESEVSREQAA